jgi:nitrogen fixation protein FixH
MRRWWLAVAVLWLAASCGGVPPSFGGQTTFRQQAGQNTVWLTVRPWPARSLTTSTFEVRIMGPDRRAVRRAAVSLDLSMPAMEMGKTAPRMEPAGPGRWQGQGVFSMNGSWQVTVQVKEGGKTQDRARFLLVVQ